MMHRTGGKVVLAALFICAAMAAGAEPTLLPGPRELLLSLLRNAETQGISELTYDDVQEMIPSITPEVFDVLDYTQNGLLSRADLSPDTPESPGDRLWFVLYWAHHLSIEPVTYAALAEVFPGLEAAVFRQLDRNRDGELTSEDYPPEFVKPHETEIEAAKLEEMEHNSRAKSIERLPLRTASTSSETMSDSREMVGHILREAESKRANQITFEAAQSVYPDLTPEEFDALDQTRDGVLSTKDIPTDPIPVLDRHRKQLLRLLVNGDRYGNGVIEYAEVAQVFPDAPAELMTYLDSGGDGVLTRAELWNVLAYRDDGEVLVPVHDVNADGITNSIDIQITVNHTLGRFVQILPADIDQSGRVNSSDIQTVIRATLLGE